MPRSAKPLVFISHSANGDKQASAELKRIVDQLEASGFDVLLDRERLKGGDQWRDCLHVWMSHCQAAIVLLTPKALGSSWVQKEATILAWRKTLDPAFVLLPVLSGGTTMAQVAAVGALDASGIPETQALKALKGASLAKELARLLALSKNAFARTPIRVLEDKVAEILSGVTRPGLLDAVATALGVDLGGWNPKRDSAGKLALALLQAVPSKLPHAIDALAGVLSQEKLTTLVRMVSGVWIDRALAGDFAVIARGTPGQRIAALNSNRPDFTPQCVLARSADAYPGWKFFGVTVSGEDVIGSIVSQVRATLAQRHPSWKPADLDIQLADLGTKEPGVIVIEPTKPPIDDAEISGLAGRFPAWTLLVLSGNESRTPGNVVKLIRPQLQDNEEADARKHFLEMEDVVARSGANR